MASEGKSGQPEHAGPSGREPLSPVKQKRLQKLFEHGTKLMGQDGYDFDYAADLFGQCVLGEPSNLSYVQAYVHNLQRKYNNNRTGSKLAMFRERGPRGARSAIKKAVAAEEWEEVIQHGLKVLTVNPWDKAALLAMAVAAGKMGHFEPQMHYLKWAREANPKDPDINKQCAIAAALMGQFDQAIALWHKVQQARPDDEEARSQIASLTVQKTIAQGKFKEAEQAKIRDRHAQPQDEGQEEEQEISMEEQIQQKIAGDPKELSNYLELGQLYINEEQYKQAEEVLAKAFEVSDGDPDVRERWEDAQVRHLRQQAMFADKKGDQEGKQRLQKELIEKELVVYKNRCERYPNNLGFKYELGLRYQYDGQLNEAIKQYQVARNDPRRKGLCMFRLGQCFQKIKQNRLAMSHYESAIEEIPDRDAKNKKDALYLAGRMAMFLGDIDTAEKHLTQLAGLDFTYKDVSTLMDKISQFRERKDKVGEENGEEDKE